MATVRPVPCEKCGQREGYLGCPRCENHICHSCAAKVESGPDRGSYKCPDCGYVGLAANAGDRW